MGNKIKTQLHNNKKQMKTFALALIATLSQSIKLRIMDTTAGDTAAGDTAAGVTAASGSGYDDMDCPPDGWLNEDGACEYPEYDYDCGPCGCDGWEGGDGSCQFPDTAAGSGFDTATGSGYDDMDVLLMAGST